MTPPPADPWQSQHNRALPVDIHSEAAFPTLGGPGKTATPPIGVSESARSTPPIPPGFEGLPLPQRHQDKSSETIGAVSPAISKEASTKQAASEATSPNLERPVASVPSSEVEKDPPKKTASLGETAKAATKAGASQLSKMQSSETQTSGAQERIKKEIAKLQEKQANAKLAQQAKASKESASAKGTTAGASTSTTGRSRTASSAKDEAASTSQVTPPRKQHPGKLDISAAAKPMPSEVTTGSEKAETPVRPPSSGGTLQRTVAKTIRIVSTPKSETAVTSAGVVTPSSGRRPSRQGSISSTNVPGTPLSEQVSESQSGTPLSQSRASSPPAFDSSASGRAKSKAQLRKERQERVKAGEETKAAEEAAAAAVVHEPILGRKKKTKKPTSEKASVRSASTVVSRASSPTSEERRDSKKQTATIAASTTTSHPIQDSTKQSTITTTIPVRLSTTIAPPEVLSGRSPTPPTTTPFLPPEETTSPRAPSPTVASILSGLKPTLATHDFFRPPPGLHAKHDITTADLANLHTRFLLTEAERAAVVDAQPVRHAGRDGRWSSRRFVSSAGRFVVGLSPEAEQAFLDAESREAQRSADEKYRPRRLPGVNIALPTIRDALGYGGTGYIDPQVPGMQITPQGDPVLPAGSTNVAAQFPTRLAPDTAYDGLEWKDQFVTPQTWAANNPLGPPLPPGANSDSMPGGGGAVGDSYIAHAPVTTGSGQNEYALFDGGRHPISPPRDVVERVQQEVEGMSLKEIEAEMQLSRKQAENWEKELTRLVRRNRKMVLGVAH